MVNCTGSFSLKGLNAASLLCRHMAITHPLLIMRCGVPLPPLPCDYLIYVVCYICNFDNEIKRNLSVQTFVVFLREQKHFCSSDCLVCVRLSMFSLLFCRHLSLIGSLLKGLISLSRKQLQKNNLFLVFNNCLHILQLLQPMLFNMASSLLHVLVANMFRSPVLHCHGDCIKLHIHCSDCVQ